MLPIYVVFYDRTIATAVTIFVLHVFLLYLAICIRCIINVTAHRRNVSIIT